jgi:hypothetical protein
MRPVIVYKWEFFFPAAPEAVWHFDLCGVAGFLAGTRGLRGNRQNCVREQLCMISLQSYATGGDGRHGLVKKSRLSGYATRAQTAS